MIRLILSALVVCLISAGGSAQSNNDVKTALAAEEFYKAGFYLGQIRPKFAGRKFEFNCLLLESYLLNRTTPADSINILLQENNDILLRGPQPEKAALNYFHFLRAWSLQNAGKGKESFELLEAIKTPDKNLLPAILYRKADLERNSLRKFDNAKSHVQEALRLYLKDSSMYFFKIYRCRLLLGLICRDMNDFSCAEHNYRLALAVLDHIPDPKYDERSKVLNNLGNLFRSDYQKAKLLYEESLEIRIRHVRDSNSLTNAYNNLGAFYYNFGNYAKAKVYYSKALTYSTGNPIVYNQLVFNYSILLNEFYEFNTARELVVGAIEKSSSTLPVDHVTVVRLRLRMVECQVAVNDIEDAQIQLGRVRQSMLTYPESDPVWVDYYDSRSLLAFKTKDFIAMRLFNDSAGYCLSKMKNQDPVLKANLLKRKADANREANHFTASRLAFEELYQHLLTYQPPNSPAVVNCMISLGEICFLTKAYDSATRVLQEALTLVSVDLPTDSARTETERLMAHAFLARTYFEKFTAFANPTDLQAAATNIDQSIAIVSHKKQSLRSDIDKINYGQNMYDVFPVAIDIYYQQYVLQPTQQNASRLFGLMELSKAQVLIRSMKDQKIKDFANVTRAVTDYERELDNRESEVRRKFDLLMAKINPEKEIYQSLQSELAELYQKKSLFIDSLRENLPDYYNLKYNQTLVTPAQLQELLSTNNGTAIVIYGAGQTNMYGILLTASNLIVLNGPSMKELAINVKLFRNQMRAQADEDLLDVSGKLYNSLLKPFAQPLQTLGISALTFIPEDALVSLPFEALVVTNDKEVRPQYLLELFTISYHYSATLFWQKGTDLHRQNASASFAGFAPSFLKPGNESDDKTRKGERQGSYDQFQFTELPGALEEVDNIQATFVRKKIPVKTFIGSDATEKAFKEAIRSHPQYLHLATHGFTEGGRVGQSGVAFHYEQDSQNDGLLLTEEVYGLTIPADLAVLSACETGIGQYHNGEGVIGLSRAFLFAGVRVPHGFPVESRGSFNREIDVSLLHGKNYKGQDQNYSLTEFEVSLDPQELSPVLLVSLYPHWN